MRDLIVGRWPELVIDDNAWIADGPCWHGQDTGLEQPLMVFCGLDESELNFDRLADLVTRRKKDGPIRLMAVFETFRDRVGFTTTLSQLSTASPDVYTFQELIVSAVPLARYKREIDRLFREEHLPGADLAVADVFVPSRAYETAHDGKRLATKGEPFELDNYVADWIVDGTPRHLALLGTYGQGKSTAALALTHKLLHDPSFAARCGNRIPCSSG